MDEGLESGHRTRIERAQGNGFWTCRLISGPTRQSRCSDQWRGQSVTRLTTRLIFHRSPGTRTNQMKAVRERIHELGDALELDERRFWRTPEGWTEDDIRALADELGLPPPVLAHMAFVTARGIEPPRSASSAGLPRFAFESREESAALQRLRTTEHRTGSLAKAIHCRGRGCRRLLARLRQNTENDGVELVLIGPVKGDPKTGRYVFAAGRAARANDIYLRAVGSVDPNWKMQIECSCGHQDTLHVGRALQEFMPSV